MAVVAVVDNKLIGLEDLDQAYARYEREIEEPDVELFQEGFVRSITGRQAVGDPPRDVTDADATADGFIERQPIGLGRPLTVLIETVYLGDYPDTMRWFPGLNLGDVLVTSAHKPFQNFDAAPRAVHALEPHAERRTYLEQNAAEQGSRLLYYTPAVTDAKILFTVELSVDREFSSELADSLSKALSAAGALPVFATAAPFLVAAGVAVPIANKAANLLASPKPYYAETVDANFALAGAEAARARALVLYPGDEVDRFAGFTIGRDNILRDEQGEAYQGELPYVVVSLDGTEHTDLEGWTAHAASAVLIERFHAPDERLTQTLDLATEALSYYNDVKYQARATKAREAAGKATGAEKARLKKLAAAYVKNIQNDTIRKTVEPRS